MAKHIAIIGKAQLFWHGYNSIQPFWKRPRWSYFVKYWEPVGKLEKRDGDYFKKIFWILGLSICW